MNTSVMYETSARSLAGTMTFPEVVQTLAAIGLESYTVDLVRAIKTFYMPNGETHTEVLSIQKTKIGERFSKQKVIDAINAIKERKLNFRQFLTEIMLAGTTTYTVYITGDRTIYFGRNGDFHIESFASAASPDGGD